MKTINTRKTYTIEFNSEALKLAERIGVAEADKRLRIYYS